MQKPNCKCIACGKEYYFCLKCNQHSSKQPAWHVEFCDETCKNIFETISSYNCGSLTKEQAVEAIGQIDSAKYNVLNDNIKKQVREIQKGDKPAKSSFSEPFKAEKKEDAPKKKDDKVEE